MDDCEHFWVNRTDGYEEECGPAICLLCGQYGCYCDFLKTIEYYPQKIKERRKKIYKELGIDGNKHEIENSLE
jgi:hypothetical protein